MTIKIQRGRQFLAGDATAALFDEKGKAGTWLAKAGEKLAGQTMTVTLQSATAGTVKLTTADDWKAFLAKNGTTKEQTQAFAAEFGITFGDFCNAVDDAAASDDKGLTLDLSPTSDFATSLSLDSVDGDYALKLAKDATLNLTGDNGATGQAQAAGVPTIGADIIAGAIPSDWERDRTEQENWGDFKNGDGAGAKFKANTGPAPYAKLTKPKWDDPQAMELVNAFTLPLHLEEKGTNPDGTTKFQDGYEMFRDTYFEGRNGELTRSGAALRARVRFDNNPPFTVNRVLVQAKEGRSVAGGDSAVHKFEKRWEGGGVGEDSAKSQLVSGRDSSGKPLVVMQKIYQLAQAKGALGADGNLQLDEKFLVLQKRRRTHLQLDSVGEVQMRLATLQTEINGLTTAGQPVPPAMQAYADKLGTQVKFLTDAGDMLRKYNQYMASGECFIVSADRYNVYDAAARKGAPPTDIDDEAGRIGKGPLHLEAEWDSASSDGFEKAIQEIDKRLAATPAPDAATVATLQADKQTIEGMRATFRKDVAQTVEVVKKQLLAQGLVEDTSKMSKDDHAQEIANSKERPVFWL